MPSDPNSALIPIVRQMLKAAITQATAVTRTPNILTGTVEDIDADTFDVAFVRMDAETSGSDPIQSDNYEAPGIVPATRLGATAIDEQVRVEFTAAAGASANRTGGIGGQRIVVDTTTGVLTFYDSTGNVVGRLTPEEWFIGTDGGARLSFDPQGGMRIRSTTDVLVATIDQQGYSLRDSGTGFVLAELHGDHLILKDSVGTDDIVLSTSSAVSFPDPKYTSATEADPGTTFVAPSVALFGTGSDLEIAHVAAWEAGGSAPTGTSFTPPTGFSEQFDEINPTAPNPGSLNVAASTKQPATGGAATSTCSSSGYQSGLSTHVSVRGGGGTAPSVRSLTKGFFTTVATSLALSLDKPTGTATGDMLLAFVALGNAVGSVPVGWTTPQGWKFLGANFLIRGTGSTQSTVAVGVWAHGVTDGGSEPATYELTINFGSGSKVLHAALIAIQNPGTALGGPNITIGGTPVKRLIASTTLASANLELANFTNIPAGPYRHLEVVFFGISDTSADTPRNIQVRLNGDSGNNYAWQLSRDAVGSQALGTSGIHVGELDGAGATHVSVGRFDVLHYATSDAKKIILSQSHAEESANIALFNGAGQWNSSAVVNAVRVLTDSSLTKFDIGSRAELYGW